MSTIEELIKRKSIRSFSDKEISEEDKKQILLASINAPSAGNQEPYRIIDVTDKEIVKELSVLCDNQPFMNQAKMVLVYCIDFKKWYDIFKYHNAEPREMGQGDFVLSLIDTTIAAQNAVTAAESLGIGSCYIGDILENKEKMCELLKLPEHVCPAVCIVFGYPNEAVINGKKPKRESLDTIVCENTYKVLNEEDLNKLFKDKQNIEEDEKLDEWVNAFCKRKYNSDFSKEMQRSVSEYLKEYKMYND
ncbi:MAG: nitroreductase family protein [Erysipelotrichaceae bacterium]|nr:nitroreductase family protein [Erysipelotrichaceae bacterium]